MKFPIRRPITVALAALALSGTAILSGHPIFTPPAVAQEAVDFRTALEPFGMWQNDPRWGAVWVPYGKPRGWRPYTVGHWVYTEEWGWYWISDDDEQDWGWVAFHYGRWVVIRGLGWAWVPGDEWAPAWVNWRANNDYVGWSALPPDDIYEEYDEQYDYWTFVPPRYLAAPRLRQFYLLRGRDQILRQTVVTNRTVPLAGGRARFAVNPGLSPARIAAASGAPLATFTVRPRVLPGTQGINGAVNVRREDLGQRGAGRGPQGQRGPNAPNVNAVSVQRASVAIQPQAQTAPPPALQQGERGRFGNRPPSAAQGATPAPPPSGGGRPAGAPPASPPANASPPAGPPPPPATPQLNAPAAPPPPATPQQAAPPAQPTPQRPIVQQPPPPPAPQRVQPAPPPGAAAPPPSRPGPPPEFHRGPPPGAPPEARPPRPEGGPPPGAQHPPGPPPQARPAPPPPAAAPPPPRPAAPPPPPPAAPKPPPPPPPAAKPAPPPPAAAPAKKPEEEKK
ncbi:MAG: hypothetical protein JO254_03635 [Pseudolabrys sp.]|nr:hypothetical protein [Pseudolabrys sp.]